MQNNLRIAYLVERAVSQQATAAELDEMALLLRNDDAGDVTRQITDLLPDGTSLPQRDAAEWEAMAYAAVAESHVLHLDLPAKSNDRRIWIRWAAAAAAVLLIGTVYLNRGQLLPQKHAVTGASPIAAPARVTLTMADGTTVELDSTGSEVIRHGGATLRQQGNAIAYEDNGDGAVLPGFNTLSTPRGNRFQVHLPDGSRVWLNAASSLRFPAEFGDIERKVEVTGEAFFEVAHDALRPFRVQVREHMQIDVLGTSFNIRAYPTEPRIAASLRNGRIRVRAAGTDDQLLIPGQQAMWNGTGPLQINSDINIGDITAWTNGELIFNDVTIAEAAEVLERWFNVSIVLKNPRIANCRFTVSFLKGETIEQVMGIITRYNGLTYQIDQKQVIIDGSKCQ